MIATVNREARSFPLLVRSGLTEAVVTAAQWVLGHPRLYRLETPYRPPREPKPITRFGARVLGGVLRSRSQRTPAGERLSANPSPREWASHDEWVDGVLPADFRGPAQKLIA